MSDQPEQLKLILDEKPAKPPKQKQANQTMSTQVKSTNPKPLKEEPKMPETAKSKDFETMLSELEKVVTQLEGELKLEEALSLFEKGLDLSQTCEKYLKQAQQRIEVLKRTASGVQTEAYTEEVEPAL